MLTHVSTLVGVFTTLGTLQYGQLSRMVTVIGFNTLSGTRYLLSKEERRNSPAGAPTRTIFSLLFELSVGHNRTTLNFVKHFLLSFSEEGV